MSAYLLFSLPEPLYSVKLPLPSNLVDSLGKFILLSKLDLCISLDVIRGDVFLTLVYSDSVPLVQA